MHPVLCLHPTMKNNTLYFPEKLRSPSPCNLGRFSLGGRKQNKTPHNSFQLFASSFWLFEKDKPLKEKRSKLHGTKGSSDSYTLQSVETELALLGKRSCVIVVRSREKVRGKVTSLKNPILIPLPVCQTLKRHHQKLICLHFKRLFLIAVPACVCRGGWGGGGGYKFSINFFS